MLLDIQNLYNKCSVEIFLSIICKDTMASFSISFIKVLERCVTMLRKKVG